MSVKHKETSIQGLQKAEAEKSKIITNATSSDGIITMTVDGGVTTGTLVKFVSPCDCVGVTTLKINGKSYSFVDSAGNAIAYISGTSGGVFVQGAVISAVIDEENSKAYIQNAAKAKADAENISYDNTESGLTAENVQGAIDELNSNKAPAYTYGTEDLEAGVSALETGKLHFVYE